MIQNFVFILNNGIKIKVGEFLPSVSLLQQINGREFDPKVYERQSGDQTFTRLIDSGDTSTSRRSLYAAMKSRH